MDWFAQRFIKSALTWFGLGVTVGLSMAVAPQLIVYRAAHMHMNLLGFVSMMIFGVAYHVIPRFVGHPLHDRRLAGWHWWIANTGLALLVGAMMLVPRLGSGARAVLATGAVLSALGAYCFIYNVWRTIDGPRGRRAAAGDGAGEAGDRVLTVLRRARG